MVVDGGRTTQEVHAAASHVRAVMTMRCRERRVAAAPVRL